jgi:hypothetical protein
MLSIVRFLLLPRWQLLLAQGEETEFLKIKYITLCEEI